MNEPDRRCSDRERDEAAARLREALAEGRLDRDEFSQRLDAVLAARTHGELSLLVDDLPAVSPLPVQPLKRKIAVSIFGSQNVTPARSYTVIASLFGSSRVDLRSLPPDAEPKVFVISVFGSTKVVVDKERGARLGGVAIFGSKRLAREVRSSQGPGTASVMAIAVMGSVRVRGSRR